MLAYAALDSGDEPLNRWCVDIVGRIVASRDRLLQQLGGRLDQVIAAPGHQERVPLVRELRHREEAPQLQHPLGVADCHDRVSGLGDGDERGGSWNLDLEQHVAAGHAPEGEPRISLRQHPALVQAAIGIPLREALVDVAVTNDLRARHAYLQSRVSALKQSEKGRTRCSLAGALLQMPY